MSLPKVICIAGPTASGKSDLALKLALKYNGEIVSCDSMQIYKGMDIGTAKPTAEERNTVPHHMVDFCDPSVPYSVADYTSDALGCIEDIRSRGKLPVICGGTGLYLDALLFSRPWDETEGGGAVRDRLTLEAEAPDGKHVLWERLNSVDPESAAKTHENNVRRVIRALEVYESTGITKTELDRRSGEPRFDFLCLCLHRKDREEQNSRIAARIEKMFEAGLPAETEKLQKSGVFEKNTTAAQAIGYKEILGFLRGEDTLEAAKEKLIIATRQYAKRQDTWFLRKDYLTVLELGAETPDPFPSADAYVSEFLKK